MIGIESGIDNSSRITSATSNRLSLIVSIKGTRQTQFEINISVDKAPLALVYQAAIDRVNEEVAPYLGEQAIQRGYESGIDVSPDTTANRIVSLSTALYGLYQQQHPEQSVEESLNSFVEIISSGVEQGFAEAKEILSGLGVLEGEIETNIDLTFTLVMGGFAAFSEDYLVN